MPSFGVTGNTLKDVSGNGNDGTLNNMDPASDWVATSKGLALEFGYLTNEAVQVDSRSLSSSEGSFFCWYKRTSAMANNQDVMLFTGFTSSSIRNFLSVTSWIKVNGQPVVLPSFNASAPSRWVVGAPVYLNEWMHFGYDWADGKPMRLWVNGRFYGQTSASFVDYGNYSSVKIGNYASANLSASGVIADAFSYNRALSPSEVKQLYLSPSAPFQKKTTTVVSVPAAPPTTTAKAVVLKKPKPSYATGYARNASESANPNLWKGLVGAWMPSFGVTGNTLKDVSGNGNDGTLTNMDAASDWVATSKGLALDFDGVNDYVSINAANLYPDLTQATWSFWIKFRSFTYFYNQISETVPAPSTTNYQLSCLVRPTGKLAFYAAGNPDSNYDNTGIHTLSTDTWYNLTYVFKGSERQEGWVNGIYDGGAGSPIASLTASTQDCRFSFSNFATRYINGTYGSVRLYSRALSPTEIKQLYLNPAAPFERKQQTVGISTAQAFNPYWANQATQLAGTLQ